CRKTEPARQPIQAPRYDEIVIAAVGDIMMPSSIQDAVIRNDYDYGIVFAEIKRDLSADLVFGNLETPVNDAEPVSGYPRFNARPELLAAIKQAGFTIVSVANNHILDSGPEGLVRTLDNLDAADLHYVGAGRTPDEAEQILSVRVRNITTAFLAYTFITNRDAGPAGSLRPVVNILRPGDEQEIARAARSIQRVRDSVDLIVVSLHWGVEYEPEPSEKQRRTAEALIEAGADVILGHHPHVLQPVETYTAKNGRQGLIAFSLGNFTSSQNYSIGYENRDDLRAPRGDEIILALTVRKSGEKVSISNAGVLPVWNAVRAAGPTTVYRPVNIPREIMRLSSLSPRSTDDQNMLSLLDYRQRVIMEHLSQKLPEQGQASQSRQREEMPSPSR
ncbi:MAG TPA: CapA family protein, partial [Nitrospirota bacterium]|nr:CapA family protein [Nitrospirota bacterium]